MDHRSDPARCDRGNGAVPSSLLFRVLGPLEVLRDGRPCTPSARKQRLLLGLLLLHTNQFLSTETIVDMVWSGDPPKSALAGLQGYVTAIRRNITPSGPAGADPRHNQVLRTLPGGYLLRTETGQLDLDEFRGLVAAGRREFGMCSWDRAAGLFRSALDLWRGFPLADLAGNDVVCRHAVRLEEERLGVVENWLDTQLFQGNSLHILGELGELSDRHPLREHFHRQLMLALHACGRRGDALNAYTRAYRIMIEEVGIEPDNGLRVLQRAILEGQSPQAVASLALTDLRLSAPIATRGT